MCATHLIISKKYKINEVPIEKMLTASQHRGPDKSGFSTIEFKNFQLFLGNNRLRINDLSEEADMPMVSDDGNFIISYNGEIYNHAALRNELKNKFPFKGQSDTETLLYWIIFKRCGRDK